MRNAIYRDNRDRLRASSEVFPSMLADFLETDVRENPGWCEELLRGLDQAWGGERFEAYGKMYALEAGPMGAELRNGYAATLDPGVADAYVAEFNAAVLRRLPRFGLEIEDV